MNISKLKQLLDKYEVDFSSWGTGNSKTLQHLLKEINLGEAKLIEKDDGLYRVLSVIVMDVYYQEGNQKYKLVEDRQVYKDGRIVRRELKNSLLEKLKPGELPLNGAKRTLSEELGIVSDVELIDQGFSHEVINAKSYPGLLSDTNLYTYEAYLTENEYISEGYKEIQEDKTNYYLWIKI